MSITAINEHLLRAIGVGVALVRQAYLQFFRQSVLYRMVRHA